MVGLTAWIPCPRGRAESVTAPTVNDRRNDLRTVGIVGRPVSRWAVFPDENRHCAVSTLYSLRGGKHGVHIGLDSNRIGAVVALVAVNMDVPNNVRHIPISRRIERHIEIFWPAAGYLQQDRVLVSRPADSVVRYLLPLRQRSARGRRLVECPKPHT